MDFKNKIIAFDADDTLWHNEINYRNAEKEFARTMLPFCEQQRAIDYLMEVEGRNMELLGYGSKTFIIDMVEAALELSEGRATCEQIREIIGIGKRVVSPPMRVFPDVERTLQRFYPVCPLVLATKGDLKDQRNKIEKSGLGKYFFHIEIMLEKNEAEYGKLLKKLDIPPERCGMVGNSFKSDIRPVIALGASAVYIPREIAWVHDQTQEFEHPAILRLNHLRELEKFL